MKNNKFLIFIILVLIITFGLAAISMNLYYQNDAFRTDLSAPRYRDLRKDIKRQKTEAISPNGEVDQKLLDTVVKKMKQYSIDISSENIFNEEALSDETLGIEVGK